MIKFTDILYEVEEIELKHEEVDYIEHVAGGILVVDTNGLSYLTKMILFE